MSVLRKWTVLFFPFLILIFVSFKYILGYFTALNILLYSAKVTMFRLHRTCPTFHIYIWHWYEILLSQQESNTPQNVNYFKHSKRTENTPKTKDSNAHNLQTIINLQCRCNFYLYVNFVLLCVVFRYTLCPGVNSLRYVWLLNTYLRTTYSDYWYKIWNNWKICHN